MKPLRDLINKKKWKPSDNPFVGLQPRRKDKETRFWLDNEYLERGYAAIFPTTVTLVYCALARRANASTQFCFPSAEGITELTGIKNRRTIFDALRILEAFNFIAVIHSKGLRPNQYQLQDVSVWEPPNSDKVEMVRKTRKKKHTVSISSDEPSQMSSPNSGTDETRNHITSQIIDSNKSADTPIKGKQLLERLSKLTASVVLPYFREEDIIAALEEIRASGEETPGSKRIHEVLRLRGAVAIKEVPNWLK